MRQYLRYVSIVFLLASLTFVLVACGGSNDAATNGNADTTNTENNDGATNDGDFSKLVVGTDAAYAPMEYIDDKGEIVGIDIDIVNAIAEEMGVEVEFKNTGWDPLFPAVNNEEVDFGVSSITITEEREKEFDFSDPYYVANQLILVPEDSDVSSFKDLEDLKVSAQMSTTGHQVVQKLLGETSPNIVATESMPLAITEMLNGNAEATVGDNSTVNEYLKNNPDVKVKTIEDDEFEKEYYGFMVKKGNQELLDFLNEGIQKIKDSGKLEEITGIEDLE